MTYVVSFCREVSGGLLIKLGCGKVGTRSGISGRLVGYVKNENRKKRQPKVIDIAQRDSAAEDVKATKADM